MSIDHVEAVFAEKTLWEYFRILLRRWPLVAVIFLLGLSVSIIVTLKTPVTYRTEMVLAASSIERGSGYIPVQLVDNPKAQLDSFVGEVSMKIVMELLKSRDTRRLVSQVLNLREHYGYCEKDGLQASVYKLGIVTSITIGKDETVLYLFVEDRDPQMAVAIARSYVDVLSTRNEELQLTSEASMVRVLDSPFLPHSRYKPSYKINAVIAFLASGTTAFFLCILLEIRAAGRAARTDSETGPGDIS